jgi:hypothetical protein
MIIYKLLISTILTIQEQMEQEKLDKSGLMMPSLLHKNMNLQKHLALEELVLTGLMMLILFYTMICLRH